MENFIGATPFIDPALMDPAPLQLLWFLLIAVLLIGYFILDGFDLGSGILYPFIAKDAKEKGLIRRSVGPLWDGNEVWLLTGGGALFAAFAPAYATSFSGFYLAIMLVLFGLIARAAALEFRSLDAKWTKLWDISFFLGSAVPALLFGVAIGNVIQGLPLNGIGDYSGLPLVGLLRPFPLVCGLLGLSQIILAGASWTALKVPTDSPVRARATKLRRTFLVLVVVLFVLATALFFLLVHPTMADGIPAILRYAFAAVFVVGIIATFVMQSKGSDLGSFITANVTPVALVGLTAASLFPYLIPSTGPGPSISIASAGGSDLALTAMTIITCIGLPLVLAYHVIIYRTFRGRLKDAEAEDY